MQEEIKFKQEGSVIWLYGLSGAGKTTISLLLKEKLNAVGYLTIILDGDELRSGINKDLSFNDTDRLENIRRVSEMAKLIASNNIWVICALITPLKDHRRMARNIIQDNFFEIFIDCPFSICKKSDVKGLYKLSEEKKIKNFTGVDSKFEPSSDSDLVISTVIGTPQQATQQLYNFILQKLELAGNNSLLNFTNKTAINQ